MESIAERIEGKNRERIPIALPSKVNPKVQQCIIPPVACRSFDIVKKFKRHLSAEWKLHLIEMTSEKYRNGGDVNSEADSSCFYYITVSWSPWRRQTFETVQKMFMSPSHAGSFRGLVMKSKSGKFDLGYRVSVTHGILGGFLSVGKF
ncbi:hypothetical protein CDAR_412081 [Caerostris darwini]|uniref:Uncharacterized protein n=1 Tax=Caerostris darwini TaxID=1538125 RepID=A0AAV4WD06_9ARAC|nr:hypothetical protein CDAR_412081 [Caerostris darwini]